MSCIENTKERKLRPLLFGFSLVELMIVVAIIAILATLAVPSYLNYTQRARFSEVIYATELYKTAISLALQQGIPLEELNLGTHGIPAAPPPTKNLASLTVKAGVITARSTKAAGDVDYIVRPNADGTVWTIEGSCLTAGLCTS